MKRNDMIIIAVCLFLALAVFIGTEVNKRMSAADITSVEVHYDGVIQDTISLDEDGVYTYEHDHGINVFEIMDGQVDMIQADCPDLSCTRQHSIGLPGENIVCLPYRFHLVVIGEEEVMIDAISK